MKITIFDGNEFGEIRTVVDEFGNVRFCAMDIAKQLGYVNSRKAIIDHCKGVTKCDVQTAGGKQKLSFITESDVYRLIIRSKLPSAEKFEKWIVEEVLPSIRKTGMYQKGLTINDVILTKAQYYDMAISKEDLTNITETAKMFDIPVRTFVYHLERMKMVYRINNVLVPSAYMQNNGYIVHKEYSKNSRAVYPHFTMKGKLYLMKKFEALISNK